MQLAGMFVCYSLFKTMVVNRCVNVYSVLEMELGLWPDFLKKNVCREICLVCQIKYENTVQVLSHAITHMGIISTDQHGSLFRGKTVVSKA
jgi:hypothetical protein